MLFIFSLGIDYWRGKEYNLYVRLLGGSYEKDT